MWSRINHIELSVFMNQISDGSENLETVMGFLKHMRGRGYSLNNVAPIIRDWDMFNEVGKAEIAVKFAGLNHSSRFIMFVEYVIAKGGIDEI